MNVGGIFCDLAKGFDCVNHEMLLNTVHIYGIQIIAAEWFRSYPVDGKHEVEIKSSSNIQNLFLKLGNNKAWSPPRVLAFHNIHKLSPCNKKYLIKTHNIADDTSVKISTKSLMISAEYQAYCSLI
jgi:hypothetical protein